jgi:hypothetical protein
MVVSTKEKAQNAMRPGLLTIYLLSYSTTYDLLLPPEFVGLFLLEPVAFDP